MLGGVRVQVSPAGDTELVSATVPVNPWTGAIVMVEVAAVPAVVVTAVGLAVTVKSFTVTGTVVDWGSGPLVPVTGTAEKLAALLFPGRREGWLAATTILGGGLVKVRPPGC